MGMKINSIRIDLEKANEGTWGNFAGAKFLIRRFNNTEAEALRNKLVMEHLEILQAGNEEAEVVGAKIDNQVLAETILIGWEGVEDEEGNEIPFSSEKALEYFSDKSLSELKQFVQSHSVNRTSYVVASEEKVAEEVKPTAVS